jgi:uncharacterized protein (DUF952 family)
VTDALFHLADPVDWDVDAPEYRAPSLATEGFIHCSTGEQLAATHARYYADRSDMVLLEIDPEAIDGSILRWEPASGGDLFAHIYGPVPARAVRAAAPYPPSVDQGR